MPMTLPPASSRATRSATRPVPVPTSRMQSEGFNCASSIIRIAIGVLKRSVRRSNSAATSS